jgi:hypothetical protein
MSDPLKYLANAQDCLCKAMRQTPSLEIDGLI